MDEKNKLTPEEKKERERTYQRELMRKRRAKEKGERLATVQAMNAPQHNVPHEQPNGPLGKLWDFALDHVGWIVAAVAVAVIAVLFLPRSSVEVEQFETTLSQ